MIRRLVLLGLLATTIALPRPANADPAPAAVEEGRARFTKGVALFRTNDFRAALVEFRGAYAVAPSFRIQFNIGQTCAELQDHACAARAFETFLADGGKQVPPGQRIFAEHELKRLRALVGRVRVLVNVPGADVAIDGAPAGTSPLAEPAIVPVGRRRITVTKPPLVPASGTIDVPAGDTVELSLALAEDGSAPTAAGGTRDAKDRTVVWIGAGVTGALLATTITFGVLALGAKSDLDAEIGRYGASPSAIADARSKVDGLALATDVLGVATLVGAGVTTFLFFRSQPPATTVGLGPGTIAVRHAF
jgi:PEGA domain